MDWKFDKSVAKIFVDHARKHIPNYDQVIDLSIDICETFDKDAKIVDIGCASGETIRRLHSHGFSNLYGIDNSEAMIEECPDYATYVLSDNYPESCDNVDVAIMNWTLHFIKDKKLYLKSIYDNLRSKGILVLSEKVSLDPLSISFYHRYKQHKGVSIEEIRLKEMQIKNVMHINDARWYLKTLEEVGFKNIQIVNANWCFNTFICFK